MKINFKTATILLAIYSNITAYDLRDYSTAVITTDSNYTYDMNFTTLFLKPSTDLLYAAQATPLPLPTPNWDIYAIQPHYNFAFDLGAKIAIHSKNSILKGNWEHFRSSDSAAHNISVSTNMVGPFFEIGPDASVYQKAAGLVNYNRDKLNITYGQNIELGQTCQINLFAGISFNRLQQNILQTFTSNDLTTYIREIDTTNSFSGVGPEVGLDIIYELHKGLNFISRTSVDFATGTAKNHVEFSSTSPLNASSLYGTGNPNTQSTTVDGQLLIVPIFSQRIGINYDVKFRGHCDFQIEIGYLSQFYTNAVHSILFTTDVPLPTVDDASAGVYAQSFMEKTSDFALGGPYFKLEIAF